MTMSTALRRWPFHAIEKAAALQKVASQYGDALAEVQIGRHVVDVRELDRRASCPSCGKRR